MKQSKERYVFYFGRDEIGGGVDMKNQLGGKGANLAEMANLGVPVPAGFTISADVCKYYTENDGRYPDGLKDEVGEALQKLEGEMGARLGDTENPLLVSVRSGAAVSMPGMMDTVLNLGVNSKTVDGLTERSGSDRFAWDSYRRFIQMYSDVVAGLSTDLFEERLSRMEKDEGVENDRDLSEAALRKLVHDFLDIFERETGDEFPTDPEEQLWNAVGAVFGSWNNERAIRYRKINNIRDLPGTAVTVQSMVFGNFGDESATGVCFTRNPSTGENTLYGEYLMNAQGEDVVAGIRTPEEIETLEDRLPQAYKQLLDIRETLEDHYKEMQDIEFTIQERELYILQTRNGKRSAHAAVKIAVDMVDEERIDRDEAVHRIDPRQVDRLLHPHITQQEREKGKLLTEGLNASPGAAAGKIVFSVEDALEESESGGRVILVRSKTSPEDIDGINASEGILTSEGGMTSHAAVVARGMGIPCVAGCRDARIDGSELDIDGQRFTKGDYITIDGGTGEVFEGELSLEEPKIGDALDTILGWADEICRRKGKESGRMFHIRANADLPEDAEKALQFGARGIGLCRTEHMFFDQDKLEVFQEMIVSDNRQDREEVLQRLEKLQRKDFTALFRKMQGYPVTIRLLDPPLHEFLPDTEEQIDGLAQRIDSGPDDLRERIDAMQEVNPMLGLRGSRLGIVYPEIYEMQVRAIFHGACDAIEEGVDVTPEVMLPLIVGAAELGSLKDRITDSIGSVLRERGSDLEYGFGTMIEVPRAALAIGGFAQEIDFVSFGTNDLTQMALGVSRDDSASFIPIYLDHNLLDADPFEELDTDGPGELIRLAMERGRAKNPDLHAGICGEHGGDPGSIRFCYDLDLDYASCSPFRIPGARLAAAQAILVCDA